MGVDEMALYIDEYTTISGGEKEYMKYDVYQMDDIYYAMREGTYCTFTEIPVEDAETLKVRGRTEGAPIYMAYSVDTDARTLWIWRPRKKLGRINMNKTEVWCDWQYYDDEHEELQHRVETLEAIDNGKYYHGGMYARDNEDMKFIIFGKNNK